MWARGPPTCMPPPLSPWGRQEAACPRVPGWGRGTGCGSSGRAWRGLGLGHTFSPRFSKPLGGLGCGMKRNRLAGGLGWVVEGDKNYSVTPSQKAMSLFSGSPIQSQAHTDLRELSGSRPRRGSAQDGGSRERERVPHTLKSCYPSPGR